MSLTIIERLDVFKRVYAKWPASWPWPVKEQRRDVLYAIWVIGNDYRNKTRYYGAYPAGLLERIGALFSEIQAADTLHAFSGSLPPGGYVRLDINPALNPDVVGSVYEAAAVLSGRRFELVIADPPYSTEDAMHYNTAMVDRRRCLASLADVTRPGGHLVWLDTCWPMHSKTQWLTVGRILIQRSTNHRARVLSIFERVAA